MVILHPGGASPIYFNGLLGPQSRKFGVINTMTPSNRPAIVKRSEREMHPIRQILSVTLLGLLMLALIPLAYFGVLAAWRMLDRVVGYQEVEEYISKTQPVIQKLRTFPGVSSISLSHDSENPSRLLIQVQVDHAVTFDQIQSDLVPKTIFRFQPKWQIAMTWNNQTVPDNTLKSAVEGMDFVVERAFRVLVASVAGPILFGIVCWLVYRRRQRVDEWRNNGVSG